MSTTKVKKEAVIPKKKETIESKLGLDIMPIPADYLGHELLVIDNAIPYFTERKKERKNKDVDDLDITIKVLKHIKKITERARNNYIKSELSLFKDIKDYVTIDKELADIVDLDASQVWLATDVETRFKAALSDNGNMFVRHEVLDIKDKKPNKSNSNKVIMIYDSKNKSKTFNKFAHILPTHETSDNKEQVNKWCKEEKDGAYIHCINIINTFKHHMTKVSYEENIGFNADHNAQVHALLDKTGLTKEEWCNHMIKRSKAPKTDTASVI